MTNTTRLSLSEIKAKKATGDVQSPAPNAPEIDLPDDFWDEAEIVDRSTKRSVHLRVDQDVFAYFKAEGSGHLTRMNAVLRSYVEAKTKRHTPN